MNSMILPEEDAALLQLGVACQTAARFYETVGELASGHVRDFAAQRAAGYIGHAGKISSLLRRDDVLPDTPDEDREWLKKIALKIQTALSSDETATIIRDCIENEHDVWNALGTLGATHVSPSHAEVLRELSGFVMQGFLECGSMEEKQKQNGTRG